MMHCADCRKVIWPWQKMVTMDEEVVRSPFSIYKPVSYHRTCYFRLCPHTSEPETTGEVNRKWYKSK